MKLFLMLISTIILSLPIYPASINKDLIPVRTDIFNSEEELESFSFKQTLSEREKNYYDNVHIRLMTGGPGSLVWENFGHSAFVVSIPNEHDIAFDYGIFSFGEGFYKNFALGRLYYSVMMSYSGYREASLIDDDRNVAYLDLELSPLEKCNLLQFLQYNAREENSTYLYDYYNDNCATRLRDAYNAIKDGEFKSWAEAQKEDESLRSYTKRYLSASSFPVDWAINYLLGPAVDEPITRWEAMFLPDVLNQSIAEFQSNEPVIAYESKGRYPTPDSYPFIFYSLIWTVVLAVPLLLTKLPNRTIRKIGDILAALNYLLLGSMSSVLLFLMVASIHNVTYLNENVVVISPLTLILGILHLVALGRKERRKGLRKLSLICLIATTLMFFIKIIMMEFFVQENIEYYVLALVLYSVELMPTIKKKQRK